ncbi:glucose-6-phosphate dehydrogenase [Candidatus Gracilibacteria bacterium]|nr:glucose-6-phosphate dehydrogenase [Candidatus Gracilibacteria bacterium]NJM90334.1 glucose-6-phosphate dehydrogenase [Hydrococcus sp. RU_2_2]NJP22226.1 glucose-6-phosphate dehydrogenase [Hydrococcus sp. CRU_1_1]
MSALTKAQIKNEINTAERLAAYAILLLSRCNPTLEYIEAENNTVRVVDVGIAAAADGSIRLIGRISIPLAPDYATNTSVPLYMHAQEISNVAVPAAYLQV